MYKYENKGVETRKPSNNYRNKELELVIYGVYAFLGHEI